MTVDRLPPYGKPLLISATKFTSSCAKSYNLKGNISFILLDTLYVHALSSLPTATVGSVPKLKSLHGCMENMNWTHTPAWPMDSRTRFFGVHVSPELQTLKFCGQLCWFCGGIIIFTAQVRVGTTRIGKTVYCLESLIKYLSTLLTGYNIPYLSYNKPGGAVYFVRSKVVAWG